MDDLLKNITPEMIENANCIQQLCPLVKVAHLESNVLVLLVDVPKQGIMVIPLGNKHEAIAYMAETLEHMADHLAAPEATEEEVMQMASDTEEDDELDAAISMQPQPYLH